MRALLLCLLVASGCSTDASSAPGRKPPSPRPLGTVSGTVTFTMTGPGAYHEANESTSETSAAACAVRVTNAGNKELVTKTNAKTGAWALKVPGGDYTVSFAACKQACCDTTEANKSVTVAAGATVTASFDCRCSAK